MVTSVMLVVSQFWSSCLDSCISFTSCTEELCEEISQSQAQSHTKYGHTVRLSSQAVADYHFSKTQRLKYCTSFNHTARNFRLFWDQYFHSKILIISHSDLVGQMLENVHILTFVCQKGGQRKLSVIHTHQDLWMWSKIVTSFSPN